MPLVPKEHKNFPRDKDGAPIKPKRTFNKDGSLGPYEDTEKDRREDKKQRAAHVAKLRKEQGQRGAEKEQRRGRQKVESPPVKAKTKAQKAGDAEKKRLLSKDKPVKLRKYVAPPAPPLKKIPLKTKHRG